MNMTAEQSQPQPAAQTQAAPKKKRGCTTCLIIALIAVIILLLMCSCCSFLTLSILGAKGQPGTIIKPSAAAADKPSGSTVAAPISLSASPTESTIDLKWLMTSTSGIASYKVYRSEKPYQNYAELTKIPVGTLSYSDKEAKKGITYYYVVTAVATSAAESGNSKSVSAIIDTPPLIPQGIYSWQDVKVKAEADPAYLSVFVKVTGLNKSDIDRLANKEKSGQTFKTTLLKGTVITNTMEDYKIVANYVLNRDREALTDEDGRPHVLTQCGNPMKLQVPITPTAVFIQQVQVIITTVVMILPPSITNIFINAGQAANGVTVAVLPGSTVIQVGPGFAPPPRGAFIDPADFGEDAYDPNAPPELEEGQQWIEEGKLLITATPPDPGPGESVTMTVKIFPAEQGVTISYSMQGTDGYTTSGQPTTDANGEITFTIPGGAAGVHDTITISVPSKGLEGTAEYDF